MIKESAIALFYFPAGVDLSQEYKVNDLDFSVVLFG